MLIEAKSKEDVERAIREHEKIVLEISSPTCSPCIVFKQRARMLMEEYPEFHAVIAYDNAVPEEIYREYFKGGHPTFVFFKDGKPQAVEYGYTTDPTHTSEVDEIMLEDWFRLVHAFLTDFKEDIYNFARKGDIIYELKETGLSQRIFRIRNKIFKLDIVWCDEITGKELNRKIYPRKVGFSKKTVTKWRIREIKVM